MDIKFMEKMLEKCLEYYGLGIFSTEAHRLADSYNTLVTIYRSEKIPGYDLKFSDRPDKLVFEAVIQPIEQAIENSPYIASLKRSHNDAMEDLRKEVARLQDVNMKLTEAISDGMEMLEQDSADNNPKEGV